MTDTKGEGGDKSVVPSQEVVVVDGLAETLRDTPVASRPRNADSLALEGLDELVRQGRENLEQHSSVGDVDGNNRRTRVGSNGETDEVAPQIEDFSDLTQRLEESRRQEEEARREPSKDALDSTIGQFVGVEDTTSGTPEPSKIPDANIGEKEKTAGWWERLRVKRQVARDLKKEEKILAAQEKERRVKTDTSGISLTFIALGAVLVLLGLMWGVPIAVSGWVMNRKVSGIEERAIKKSGDNADNMVAAALLTLQRDTLRPKWLELEGKITAAQDAGVVAAQQGVEAAEKRLNGKLGSFATKKEMGTVEVNMHKALAAGNDNLNRSISELQRQNAALKTQVSGLQKNIDTFRPAPSIVGTTMEVTAAQAPGTVRQEPFLLPYTSLLTPAEELELKERNDLSNCDNGITAPGVDCKALTKKYTPQKKSKWDKLKFWEHD